MSSRCRLGLQIPNISVQLNICAEQTSLSHADFTLQGLKDLLLTCWRQIPQRTSRGLLESMPRGSELLLKDPRNIREVVIMLWLITCVSVVHPCANKSIC